MMRATSRCILRSAPRKTGRHRNCILATVVAGLLIYLNAASLLQACRVRIDLPRPWYASRLFQVFSLFGYYTKNNYGYELQVRSAEDTDNWFELNPYEFFPQTLGEANRRLNFYSYHSQPERKSATYRVMADRIKVRYNRAHAEESIDRVQIYLVEWPKSPDGFKSRYGERKWRVLYDG